MVLKPGIAEERDPLYYHVQNIKRFPNSRFGHEGKVIRSAVPLFSHSFVGFCSATCDNLKCLGSDAAEM